VPAYKSENAVILPVGRLCDFRERCALLALINSRTIDALLPDFAAPLALVALPFFLAVAAFFDFVAFLLAFAFFGFAVSVLVVVSCVLIVVLLWVNASDDTFITPARKECEAKDGDRRPIKKGLDRSAGNEACAQLGLSRPT